MKYIAPMAAFALAATQVSAGSMVTPDVGPMIEVAEDQSPARDDWIVPLLAIGAIAVIVTNRGGTQSPTPC